MQLAEDATNANGSALENNAKYMASFSGKAQLLKTTAQAAWIEILDTNTIKSGIDLLTSLLQVITDIVDQFGLLPTIGAGVGLASLFKSVNLDQPKFLAAYLQFTINWSIITAIYSNIYFKEHT